MSRLQADSRVWFQQRAGRITASKFQQILHTDCSQPSLSWLHQFVYPDKHKAISIACQYGCKHENIVREQFTESYTHDAFCH